MTKLAVLTLLLSPLVLTGCFKTACVIDGSLTVPMDKAEVIKGGTIRDLAEKYVERGAAIDEGNLRFKAVREQ